MLWDRRGGFLTAALAHPSWKLCCLLLMQQAAVLDGLSLDALAFPQDGLTAAGVDVGGCEITKALVSAPAVVGIDEGFDPRRGLAGQIGVLERGEEDQQTVRGTGCPTNVLRGLVPALDLALGLRMTGCTMDMLDLLAGEPVGQVTGNGAWPVVGQQPWPTCPRLRAA